jgi:hypothetical protein
VSPSGHVVGGAPPQLTRHVAGSAQWTLQWPPGHSTEQAPVHVTSHEAAPSQCTTLPSPTFALQLCLTYWQATMLPWPPATAHVRAFWHEALQRSPP